MFSFFTYKCDFHVIFIIITIKYSSRIHISLIKFTCIENVLMNPPIELKQPKNLDFKNMSIYA